MGYTPVFDTVFDGSMCGQWPVLPVWLTLLPLADWRGHIDMTPQAIAGRTGWPLELLLQGIRELCEPDPDSRSKEEEGRRLVPIDPERSWGWRVVNIDLYRRRCRDANDVAEGRAAERAKRYRERHAPSRAVTSSHVTSPDSDSYTNSYTDSEKKPPRKKTSSSVGARERASRTAPEDFSLSPELREWSASANPQLDVDAEFARFHDHEFKDPHVDWVRCWRRWVREGLRRGEFSRKVNGQPPGMEAVRW